MSAHRVQQKELVSQKGLCYNRVVYYRRMRNGGYAAYKRLYLEAGKRRFRKIYCVIESCANLHKFVTTLMKRKGKEYRLNG